MSDTKNAAAALLERLRHKGLHLSATADGSLQVWPAVWLDEATSEAIRNQFLIERFVDHFA